MSICIINVGNTGTGKTTETKDLLNAFKITEKSFFIYDVNKEFLEFYEGKFLKFKEFLKEANTKTNTVIVFEEATIFFQHNKTSEDIYELLVRKRHTNNTLIFNFHALHQVPIFILDFANYMILRQTNDVPSLIQKKFETYKNIYESFEFVQESENFFEKQYIKLN